MIYVYYSTTTHFIRLHPRSLGDSLYCEVERKTKVPAELLLLFHGGKFVQNSISFSRQNIVDGSTVLSLVKGYSGTGNEKAANEDPEGNNIRALQFVLEFALLIKKLRSDGITLMFLVCHSNYNSHP